MSGRPLKRWLVAPVAGASLFAGLLLAIAIAENSQGEFIDHVTGRLDWSYALDALGANMLVGIIGMYLLLAASASLEELRRGIRSRGSRGS